MFGVVVNNINLVIIFGQFGLQRLFDGMMQFVFNIVQCLVQQDVVVNGFIELLVNVVVQSLLNIFCLLFFGGDSFIFDLLLMQLYSKNVLVLVKVIDVVNDIVGKIIDMLV